MLQWKTQDEKNRPNCSPEKQSVAIFKEHKEYNNVVIRRKLKTIPISILLFSITTITSFRNCILMYNHQNFLSFFFICLFAKCWIFFINTTLKHWTIIKHLKKIVNCFYFEIVKGDQQSQVTCLTHVDIKSFVGRHGLFNTEVGVLPWMNICLAKNVSKIQNVRNSNPFHVPKLNLSRVKT